MTGIGQRSRGNGSTGCSCGVGRSLEIVGDRWTLLLLHKASEGTFRFEGFREGLGIARNILSGRLRHMVEEGLFERIRYQTHPDRFEYRLTKKGQELVDALDNFGRWAERWVPASSAANTAA